MEKNELFEFAEVKGHNIVYFPLPVVKSLSMPLDMSCVVGLDPNLTDREQTACLAHELGHCEYGGFYSRDVQLDMLERHEYRANVWAVRQIIPWRELKKAVHSGMVEKWELADHFNTTEEMITFAVTYYTERRRYQI